MQVDFEYRGYVISRHETEYIARPIDPDESDPEIVASTVSSLIRHIDAFWGALDSRSHKPRWIRHWLKNVDLARLYPDRIIEAHRRRMKRLKLALSAVLCGVVAATGASALDVDEDGKISFIDAFAAIDRITQGRLGRTVMVKMEGQVYAMTYTYTNDPAADVEITRMKALDDLDDPIEIVIKRDYDGHKH